MRSVTGRSIASTLALFLLPVAAGCTDNSMAPSPPSGGGPVVPAAPEVDKGAASNKPALKSQSPAAVETKLAP